MVVWFYRSIWCSISSNYGRGEICLCVVNSFSFKKMNPLHLGGLSRRKDKRDFKLGQYQAPLSLPLTYSTDVSNVEPLYQAQWPACGAHSGAHFKEIQEGGGKFSPNFLWTEIKKIDGFPPTDGTDLTSIFKTLLNKGVCDYSQLPNDYLKDLSQYTHTFISQEMYDNAKPKGISGYAFSDKPSVHDVMQAIYQNKQVLLLIYCDDGFFGTKNPTFNQKKYGHFVVAYGWDLTGILIVDSTEQNTVLSFKKIPFSAISFIRELGTAIDLPDQFIFKNNLYFGMRNNPEVIELQKRLGVTPNNGNFGPVTLLAVLGYQKVHLIPTTGFVGALTRASLNTS